MPAMRNKLRDLAARAEKLPRPKLEFLETPEELFPFCDLFLNLTDFGNEKSPGVYEYFDGYEFACISHLLWLYQAGRKGKRPRLRPIAAEHLDAVMAARRELRERFWIKYPDANNGKRIEFQDALWPGTSLYWEPVAVAELTAAHERFVAKEALRGQREQGEERD